MIFLILHSKIYMKKGLRGEATLEKKNKTQEMKEKLEYIGLNLDEIPKTLKLVEDLKFRPNSGFDEKKYRQYRFVSPKEIQILLSPTNRLDDIKEKYSKASPLADYLENDIYYSISYPKQNLNRTINQINLLKALTKATH